MELKRPRTGGLVSLPSNPLKGEDDVRVETSDCGVESKCNNIDNISERGFGNSVSSKVVSQSKQSVSSSVLGEKKRSQPGPLQGPSDDRHRWTQLVADNFSDAGLVQNRTSFDDLLCIDFFQGLGDSQQLYADFDCEQWRLIGVHPGRQGQSRLWI